MQNERGVSVREEFGAIEKYAPPETAATAVAARERAAVEARYLVAFKRPRELEAVRIRLLKECERPGFAEVARYVKPIGQDEKKWPRGPSIRFAETALRCFTNVYPEQSIVFEDDSQRIVRVTVTDLEANISYSSEILVKKTMERKFVKEGQEVISRRLNSQGKETFLVYATDDDVQNKQNALISKAIRNNGLRLLPGDLVEECMEKVLETQRTKDKADPDAAKRKVIDAFAEIGVKPEDLQLYLGHPLDRLQPAELADLRAHYASIRDGEATWDAVMEAKSPTGTAEEAQKVGAAKIQKIKEAIDRKAADQADPGAQPAQTEGEGLPFVELTEEQMQTEQRKADEAEAAKQQGAGKLQFGRRAGK